MRQVGTRRERPLARHASGELLAEGARFSETVANLAKTTFIPKGVYRFRSHEEANLHEAEHLAQGMGKLAGSHR
jgi:hypothetical protein